MIGHVLAHRAFRLIHEQSEKPSFPFLVSSFSFAATFAQIAPVEWLVVSATLASPRRWLAVSLAAAFGSGVGAIGLYLAFHHFGWDVLTSFYPELTTSRAWNQASDWLSRYGMFALFALMELPLPVPKLPALAFAGLYEFPFLQVAVVIWAGRALKYSGYARVAACFPSAMRKITAFNAAPTSKSKTDQ